eukprot:3484403-Pyramimonas_sp.AAC.1
MGNVAGGAHGRHREQDAQQHGGAEPGAVEGDGGGHATGVRVLRPLQVRHGAGLDPPPPALDPDMNNKF